MDQSTRKKGRQRREGRKGGFRKLFKLKTREKKGKGATSAEAEGVVRPVRTHEGLGREKRRVRSRTQINCEGIVNSDRDYYSGTPQIRAARFRILARDLDCSVPVSKWSSVLPYMQSSVSHRTPRQLMNLLESRKERHVKHDEESPHFPCHPPSSIPLPREHRTT